MHFSPISHKPRNAHFGRDTHQHMYMILGTLHLQLFLLLSIGFRIISLISNRFSSKNTFRLYLGENTMQFHFVCAKLSASMFTFFIDKSSKCVFCVDWQVISILSHWRFSS